MDNQIILSGLTVDQLFQAMREMVAAAVKESQPVVDEALLSPKEAVKIFVPAITRQTLTNWTSEGLINVHRIGGRNFYKRTEVLSAVKTIKKYGSKK